jgi:hypothetical protein
VFLGQVPIAHRHRNAVVTHELLDGANIHPGHHKAAGKGVPQAVPRMAGSNQWHGQRFAQSIADHWPGAISALAEFFERSQRRAI